MRHLLPLMGLLLAISFSGCVYDVDLEGRSCPCDEGWSCDSDQNICVRGAAQICGLSVAVEPANVTIDNLRINWATDVSLEVGWDLDAEKRDLIDHYELVIGLDEEAVRTRGADVTIFDSSYPEHPELFRPVLPENNGQDVDRTVLRDLSADTTYFIRLTVFDVNGGASCPAVLEARTWLATTTEFIVADETEVGWFLPACVVGVTDALRAASGSAFAEYTAVCEELSPGETTSTCDVPTAPAMTCYENLRMHGISPVPLSIGGVKFAGGAHVRMDVALDNMDDAYFSEIGLSTPLPPGAPIGGSDYLWYAPNQTLVADGTYRTYSIPLRRMFLRCNSGQHDQDDLRVAAGEEPLCGSPMRVEDAERGFISARVGATFEDGGSMRMDNVRVYF